ncbi:MAG TPA: glycosyltransferase family A protein [Planctomycetota bacterium]|nr:glycosyltransferase family A protein [Planctomycetota bacterium]
MPRVSVLIPVHDAGPFLNAALGSVARQTFRDFEALLLDDGSTDGSAGVLAEAARCDPRFRVLSPGRVGLVRALNLLREAARAPLLARFDADDVMHPRRLELQVEYLEVNPGIGAVASLVRHFPRREVRGGNLRYEAWLNALVTPEEIERDLLVESPLPHPSVTMRALLFDRVGGYRDVGHPEDYDLWLRAWGAGFRFGKVPRVLHAWRDHPRRLTRTHPRCGVEAFLRAKAEALLSGPLAGVRPYVVWGAGMFGRRLARLLLRAGRPPAALLDIDRKKIGRTRHGRPIVPPEAFRPGSALVLGAVGAAGARELIRKRLRGMGLVETRDFWMVA